MVDLELYFIGFIFCTNREMLKKENRGIYDAMFGRYEKIARKQKRFNLQLLNDEFKSMFKGKGV